MTGFGEQINCEQNFIEFDVYTMIGELILSQWANEWWVELLFHSLQLGMAVETWEVDFYKDGQVI